MSHLVLSGLLICIAGLLCSALTFFSKPRNSTKNLWSIFCLAVSCWGFGLYRGFLSANEQTVLYWSRFLNLSAVSIPILLFHFVLVFTNRNKSKRKELAAAYVLGIACAGLALIFPQLFIPKVMPKLSFAFYPEPGILYDCFFIFFAGVSGYSAFLLLVEYFRSEASRKYQIRFILFGVSMGFAGGATTFLPVYNIPVYPLGTYFVIVYITSVAYAIVKYRLLELNILLSRITQYALLIAFLLLVANPILIFFFKALLPAGMTGNLLLIVMAFALGIAVLENKNWYDRFMEQLFSPGKLSVYHTMEKAIFNLNRLVNYEDVLKEIVVIAEKMEIQNLALYIQEKIYLHYFNCVLKTGEQHPPYPERLDTGTSLVKYIVAENRIIETDEFRHHYGHLYKKDKIIDYEKHGIQESMDILKAKIIIPIEIKGVILGILFIGEKVTGGRYTQQDLEIIKLLGYQVTNAIENIQLYERMLDTERLSTLGIMAAEIAHEIRNPLTGVISMINLLPRMKDNPGYLEKFMGIVPGELQRVINITASLMEFARPSHLMFEEIDLKNIVEQTLDLLGSKITGRNLKITREMDELPSISADKQQLKQVILNILLNAIDASPEGSEITLRAELPKNESHSILLSIKDRGEGIEKEKLDKIFLPFFTTKVNGCGLGLSICKRIIEEHHGDIHVESEEGKGSTFYIRLPLRR